MFLRRTFTILATLLLAGSAAILSAGHTAESGVLLRQVHQIFQRIGAAGTRDVHAELDALTCPKPG
jgi:hypothetical protein